jgi:hypothetical protein
MLEFVQMISAYLLSFFEKIATLIEMLYAIPEILQGFTLLIPSVFMIIFQGVIAAVIFLKIVGR